jgi:superfamily I DNA and/or RNA helicase
MSRNINDEEARLMLNELTAFRDNLRRGGKYVKDDGTEWEVLLLSFYKPQRNRIAELMRKTFPENDNYRRYTRFNLNADSEGKHKIHVYAYTVDNVQGKENDLVFLSMVRRDGNSIGFLDSPNRLNVAITRARYQLIIFGDKRFYERQNDYSHELSFLAKGVNAFNPIQPPVGQSKTGIRVKS